MLDKPTVVTAWTEDRVAFLRNLHDQGLSATLIANQIGGITRCAVIGKLSRLGLSGRTSTSHANRQGDGGLVEKFRFGMQARKALANRDSGSPKIKRERFEARESAAKFLSLTFLEAADNSLCMYPQGEGRDIRFCGQPTVADQPYCRNCRAVCYRPFPVRTDKRSVPL